MIKRSIVAATLLLLLAQPAFAGFRDIAGTLEDEFGFRRTWIPFLGMARLAVWTVHPKGVHDFQLAVYENRPDVDPRDVERMLARKVPKGFMPLVRAHSARKGEWSFIYARPARNGRTVELLVLAHDGDETVLVRVAADTEIVARELDNPIKVRHIADR